MNYSNMIEEKNLKKSFIIATLISTVVGTFTASMNLHDKVQEKRNKAKQQKVDQGQTAQIKQLEEKVRKLQIEEGGSKDRSSSSSRSSSGGNRRRNRRDSVYEDDEFMRSTRKSRAMIEDQYEDYLSRVGSRYARGDVITENKLQAQIISLQQTVITVLQDALVNDRSLTKADINKLVAAQQAARTGTLDALQDQYSRMRIGGDKQDSRLLIEAGESFNPVQRQRTLPSDRTESLPPARRVQSLPIPAQTPFCRYSEDLQLDNRRPLASAFNGNGNRRCPACDTKLQVDSQSFWVFSLPEEDREYSLDARFVIKCHTADGEFACVICHRTRDVDCFCGNVESLVKHLGRDHGVQELQGEIDFMRSS